MSLILGGVLMITNMTKSKLSCLCKGDQSYKRKTDHGKEDQESRAGGAGGLRETAQGQDRMTETDAEKAAPQRLATCASPTSSVCPPPGSSAARSFLAKYSLW